MTETTETPGTGFGSLADRAPVAPLLGGRNRGAITATLGALCVVCVMCVAGPAAADPTYVIPAGREAQVQALFAPYSLGQELAGGWRLENLKIESGEISLELFNRSDQKVTVLILHPSEGGLMGRKAGAVVMEVPNSRPADVDPAIDKVAEALTRNAAQAEGLWARPPGADGGSDRRLRLPPYALPLAGLAVVALFGIGSWRRRKQALATSAAVQPEPGVEPEPGAEPEPGVEPEPAAAESESAAEVGEETNTSPKT